VGWDVIGGVKIISVKTLLFKQPLASTSITKNKTVGAIHFSVLMGKIFNNL
jgi:hypothetical protein